MAVAKSLSMLMRSHSRRMSICSSEKRSRISSALPAASNAYLCIPSLHPVVGASDGRGHPGKTQAENAAGRGGTVPHVLAAPPAACGGASPRLPSLRAGWRIFAEAVRRIEDSWIGDFIGAASLFALCWMLLLLGFAGGIG